MEFSILTLEGETLNRSLDIPPEMEKFRLACAAASGNSGDFGSMLFQHCRNEGFDIWYSNYIIHQASALRYKADQPLLVLQTMLQNDLHGEAKGLGKFLLKQHQFNMTYLPQVDCAAYFGIGEYSNFEIHYSVAYLEKYVLMLPILQPFLKNIESGTAANLLPTHAFATPEMLSVIQQIINSGYNDELQKVYFDIKASELLFLALRKAGPATNGQTISGTDTEKMYAAKAWLESNIDSPATLAVIAKAVGTNEFKLKKGFKEVFGATVFDYLLNLRMERAMQLLSDTNKSIADIAYLTGYSSHPSFTNAFTKHFGFSPNYLRKR